MTVPLIHMAADASADFEHWKKVRRNYLTSSDMFTWVGEDIPDWWSDTRTDILHEKLTGEPREFDPESETSIAHGRFDEANIQLKFAHAVGCRVESHNGLYVNNRWPYLAASIDGFGFPSPDLEQHPEFFQKRSMCKKLRETIDTRGVKFVTEVKKSTSSKWQTEVPAYYLTQVQTQLAILRMPYAIIMAETVKRGKVMKWRQFWDLRAYVIEADPSWPERLDEIDKQFEKELDHAFEAML